VSKEVEGNERLSGIGQIRNSKTKKRILTNERSESGRGDGVRKKWRGTGKE
jgi:hypothetical protein